MHKFIISIILFVTYPVYTLNAQNSVSQSWISDLGNGKYRNPVLNADYSDPDVCRVGDDYI